MIIEQHALWGDESTAEHPATYTAYLADALPGKPDERRPAAVICGGGAFQRVAEHEQEPVAFAFLNAGYQAFVLDYVTNSTGDVSYPAPEADLAKMLATVRANAEAWRVDPDKVCAVGFSAGGFICASVATSWKDRDFASLVGDRPERIRPDAVVLGYPLIDLRVTRDERTRDPRIDLRVPKTGGKTGRDLLNDYLSMVVGGEATEERLKDVCPTTHVTRDVPPTFVWGTADDKTCPIVQVHAFAAALAREGVAHEVHVFDQGGHCLSVANRNTCFENEEQQRAVGAWFDLACAFLARQGVA
ncbi:alpha/beta hydrolase [Collinsella sp. An2]|uniref:alpha/beta hydrolase n=1 Tax=Collinsella sp. An2 TaxID=1965585 RepID=UPI000B382B0A|nr:alpha/beta hydrolase [Collinsella sp. An2]OUP08938.1 alpha/beta hydrolase [Collinsella sp. An2]